MGRVGQKVWWAWSVGWVLGTAGRSNFAVRTFELHLLTSTSPFSISPTHQSPDVRHGPAQCVTAPPAKPRRSVVTRTGRPSATATRAGTGWRQRRRADNGTEMAAELAATGLHTADVFSAEAQNLAKRFLLRSLRSLRFRPS